MASAEREPRAQEENPHRLEGKQTFSIIHRFFSDLIQILGVQALKSELKFGALHHYANL